MKKYRKRPLVVEAAQWDGVFLGGKRPEEVLKGASWSRQVWIDDSLGGPIFIGTLEGQMKCNLGDWIIKCGTEF